MFIENKTFIVQFMNSRKESVRRTQHENPTVFNATAVLKENRRQNFEVKTIWKYLQILNIDVKFGFRLLLPWAVQAINNRRDKI